MAEIPNVIPGEPVESDWGNDIRDRVVQRFPDATARDLSLPIPESGAVTWIDTPGQLDVWDGTTWTKLVLDPELVAGLALKVNRAGDTMTGPLLLPTLIASQRLEGPLEVFYADVTGSITLSTVDQEIDSFTVPRTGRWMLDVVVQGSYASLTDADVMQMKIKQNGSQVAISTNNMFRAWGAPGVTTGHFNAQLLYRSPFISAGTEYTVSVSRFGTTGGATAQNLQRSAQNVENI